MELNLQTYRICEEARYWPGPAGSGLELIACSDEQETSLEDVLLEGGVFLRVDGVNAFGENREGPTTSTRLCNSSESTHCEGIPFQQNGGAGLLSDVQRMLLLGGGVCFDLWKQVD